MSLALNTYPVFTKDGIIYNIFPGYMPLNVTFIRQDVAIVGISQGANNKVLITINSDLTDLVDIGEGVYVYSVGATYTYDVAAKVLDFNWTGVNTELTIDATFIEISSGGYCNYLQDWLTEVQLVDESNSDILLFNATLSDDGDSAGNVSIDVSIIVDLLDQYIREIGREVEEGRIKFKVQYRESYRDNRDNAYTLIDDTPLIVYFGAEDVKPETFVNAFDNPVLWSGYLTGISFLHSDANYATQRIRIEFDELDINKDNITTGNLIRQFEDGNHGFLFVSNNDIPEFSFNENTRFGRLKAIAGAIPDFRNPDFETPDFETTN